MVTDDEINLIAERAAEKAIERVSTKFYTEVGRSIVNRWLVVLGAIVVGFAYAKGWFTFTK